MANEPTHPNRNDGRFQKGKSGNPAGRPKVPTNHAAELRSLETDAINLAVNTAAVIAETMRQTLTDVGLPELAPLIKEISTATQEAVKEGEIGPSTLVPLRSAYVDHREHAIGEAFFIHVGLPADCTWRAYRKHYSHQGGRIDHGRHADDLASFPPIAEAVAEFKANARAT
jgi:hypothetical protein